MDAEFQKKYDALCKEQERKLSERRQRSLATAMDFLNQFKDEVKEIELLQGKQRFVRLKDLKRNLVESLINKSAFRIIVDEEYMRIIFSELMYIYDME